MRTKNVNKTSKIHSVREAKKLVHCRQNIRQNFRNHLKGFSKMRLLQRFIEIHEFTKIFIDFYQGCFN